MTTVTSGQNVELEQLIEESRERVARGLRGRDRWATIVGAAGFLAVAVPLAVFAQTERSTSPALVALFVVSYAVVSRVEFEIGAGSAIPTQLVFVPMLFVVPARVVPLCVALGLILGALPEVRRSRMHAERLLVQLVSSWHAVGPAVVMVAAGEPGPTLGAWPVVVAALVAQLGVDFTVAAAREHVVYGISPRELVGAIGAVYAVDVVLTPVGFASAVATADEPALGALFVLPLAALLAVFARERQHRIDNALELSHAYRGTAFLLGDVVEADDAYTGAHSHGVVELSLSVADALGVSPRERRHTELAALLHDVGKIRIPNEIINKPGPLTPEEREIIETHTIEGELLLAKVGGLLGEVGQIVRSCHERYDGLGYPDGTSGTDIPLVARIVSACDTYHAIITDRPYRSARTPAEAVGELLAGRGTQFDPHVVDALVEVVSGAAR